MKTRLPLAPLPLKARILSTQLKSGLASHLTLNHSKKFNKAFTGHRPSQFIVKFFGTLFQGYQITMSYTADGRYKMELSNATMTSSTFRFLDFNTRYTFEVRTRFSKDNSLGPPVHVIKRTDAFTAPVGHLTAKVGYNSVLLYWSAPGTIRPRALKVPYSVYFLFFFFFGSCFGKVFRACHIAN